MSLHRAFNFSLINNPINLSIPLTLNGSHKIFKTHLHVVMYLHFDKSINRSFEECKSIICESNFIPQSTNQNRTQ